MVEDDNNEGLDGVLAQKGKAHNQDYVPYVANDNEDTMMVGG